MVAGVLGTGTHGELIHVGLSDEDGSGGAQAGDHGSVVWRNEALEDARSCRCLDAGGAEEVLEGDGNAGEWRRCARITAAEGEVGVVGLCEGLIGGHGDEGTHLGFRAFDLAQDGVCQFGRRNLPADQEVPGFGRSECGQVAGYAHQVFPRHVHVSGLTSRLAGRAHVSDVSNLPVLRDCQVEAPHPVAPDWKSLRSPWPPHYSDGSVSRASGRRLCLEDRLHPEEAILLPRGIREDLLTGQ